MNAVGFCKQGVCSESASFDLPAGVLASCVQEVQSALEIALVRRENGSAQRGGEIFVAGGPGTNNVVPCKQARKQCLMDTSCHSQSVSYCDALQ